MPDKQIHPTGTVSAPADYTVSSGSEVLLKSVYAKFDGSGAAGSYIPLLRIISNAGSITDEIPQDVTVAAGASADATWFPHLATAAAAPIAASGVPRMDYFTRSTTVTATNTAFYMDGQTFSPDVTGVFAASSTVIGGNTYHGVSMLAAGVYLVMGQASGSGATTGDLITFDPEIGGGSLVSGWVQGNDQFLAQTLGVAGSIRNYVAYLTEVTTPPTTAEIWALRNATHASGHAVAQIVYLYLGTGTAV